MSVITLNFEGYIQCRLATDPDPTDERRGVSGYTFALPGEPDLDWTIYTQPGKGVVTRVGVDRPIGVKVTSGYCGTQPIVSGHPLYGATVNLESNPRFEERNYIVITQQFGVIAPFKLRVRGAGIELYRQVDFYPGKPLDFPLLETPQSVLMPYTMQNFTSGDPNCTKLLGPSGNPSVYRQERLNKLLEIKRTARLTPDALAAIDKRIEELRMDNPQDRRTFQLANSASYSYALNGPASVKFGKQSAKSSEFANQAPTWLNGEWQGGKTWVYAENVKPIVNWPCNFWIGSWDADSLTAYMGGTFQVFDLGPSFDDWIKG